MSIGTVPNQFPFFGGLMWGGVGVCVLRIARKFHTKPLKTALLAGWLVVSMDLLLDVAAIRLDGVTDERASFVGFITLWSGLLGSLVRQLVRARGTLSPRAKRSGAPHLLVGALRPPSRSALVARRVPCAAGLCALCHHSLCLYALSRRGASGGGGRAVNFPQMHVLSGRFWPKHDTIMPRRWTRFFGRTRI